MLGDQVEVGQTVAIISAGGIGFDVAELRRTNSMPNPAINRATKFVAQLDPAPTEDRS